MIKFLKYLKSQRKPPNYKKYVRESFSQTGEDMIVKHIFKTNKMTTPNFLDIGAFHPWLLNNTARFYLDGSRGINVEPNPNGMAEFIRDRPEDVNLNYGIGLEPGLKEYFMYSNAYLNTFSKEEVDRIESEENKVPVKTVTLQILSVNELVNTYCSDLDVDFLTIDVEGMDIQIIDGLFELKLMPKVICIESIDYSSRGEGRKNENMISSIKASGYKLYADTNINSIFVRSKI